MTLVRSYPGSLNLPELQAILDQDEMAFGPIEAFEVTTNVAEVPTTVIFDDSIVLSAPMSVLADSGKTLINQIVYTRGQVVTDGTIKEVFSVVKLDKSLLALRCLSYFQSFGWTRNQAIGITSNINCESGFDPAKLGDGNTAYGLCQWRGSRQTDFKTMHGNELVGSTFRDQLEFIVFELSHSEHVAGAALRATTSVADAATAVCLAYERPAHPEIEVPKRVAYALTLDGPATVGA